MSLASRHGAAGGWLRQHHGCVNSKVVPSDGFMYKSTIGYAIVKVCIRKTGPGLSSRVNFKSRSPLHVGQESIHAAIR